MNFYGSSRTSYFKIKDEAKFLEWVSTLDGVEAREKATELEGKLFCLIARTESGEFPWSAYDEEADEFEDFSMEEQLARHLADGWACVTIEVGAEGLRFLQGYCSVTTNKGVLKSTELNSWAAEVCKEAGVKHTGAAY